MLEVALMRLKEMWPDARFTILSADAGACGRIAPEAEPASVDAWKSWVARKRRSWKRLLPNRALLAGEFENVLLNSDLVVLAGSGILTDAFESTALRILETLGDAKLHGIPTVILGQGIGPIESPVLLAAARNVLPQVDAVFVREPDASVALLHQLCVPPERIQITGDDAIEPAWRQRFSAAGDRIGVNLRVAGYGGVDRDLLPTVRDVLHQKATALRAKLLGIPITRGPKDSDLLTLKALVPEDGDCAVMSWTTGAVIQRVARCRMVVAGSYHAGVFALAQGIPVVAVVQSDYYARKFDGLVRQFGAGCEVLSARDAGFAVRLADAVDETWNAGLSLKAPLIAAASRQIAAGRNAFDCLPRLLSRGLELRE
jgi:polysaccharide pyruvyl transferase WcaK-like protein